MASSLLKWAALVAALAMALTVALRALRPVRPPLDEKLHEAVGRVLAEETARLLGGSSDLVLVVPEAPFDMPLVAAQLRSFQKALDRQRGMRVVARESIRLERMGPLDGLLTPDRYFELAQKHGGAGALVTFVGLGDFRDADLARVKPGMPPLYVLSPNLPVSDRLILKRLVGMAIVPQRAAGPAASARGRERFDRSYAVVGTGGRP